MGLSQAGWQGWHCLFPPLATSSLLLPGTRAVSPLPAILGKVWVWELWTRSLSGGVTNFQRLLFLWKAVTEKILGLVLDCCWVRISDSAVFPNEAIMCVCNYSMAVARKRFMFFHVLQQSFLESPLFHVILAWPPGMPAVWDVKL